MKQSISHSACYGTLALATIVFAGARCAQSASSHLSPESTNLKADGLDTSREDSGLASSENALDQNSFNPGSPQGQETPGELHRIRSGEMRDRMTTEELVTLCSVTEDPQIFLDLLRLNADIPFTEEQKRVLMRQAYLIDPHQNYFRELGSGSTETETNDRVELNGKVIFEGEIRKASISVTLDSASAPQKVTVHRGEESYTVSLSGRTDRGGYLFYREGNGEPRTAFEVQIHASPRGVVLDLTLPRWPPFKIDVWKGKELPDDPEIPEPITNEVKQILYPS